MMIVIAIIGVLMALSIAGWRRAGMKRDVHNALGDIESVVRTARNLSAIAGGAIGTPAFTNCLVMNGGGAAPAGDQSHLSILIDGPSLQVVAPIMLQDDGAGAFWTVCETIDLTTFSSDGQAAELLAGTNPANAITLAFSQLGRPYVPPGAPAFVPSTWNIGVRTVGAEAGIEEGLQILPSGVMCRRKITGLPVNAPITCDQS